MIKKILIAILSITAAYILLQIPTVNKYVDGVKENYYDIEKLSIPFLINIQREINTTYLPIFYSKIYPHLVWLAIIALLFSVYRKPSILWLAFFAIAFTRIFIPIIMGASLWRFALAGLIPMLIFAITWIEILFQGITKKDLEGYEADSPSF